MGAFVQKTCSESAFATTCVATLPGGVTSGNTLVIAFINDQGGSVTAGSVSGCGATWAKQSGPTLLGAARNSEVWVGFGATTGTTVTITWNSGNSARSAYILAEFSGAGTVLSQAVLTGSSNAPASGQVSATASGQVSFAAVFSFPAVTSWTDSPSAFTDLVNANSAAIGVNYAGGYLITAGSATCQRGGTASTSGAWTGFGLQLGPSAPSTAKTRPIHVQTRAVMRAAVI